MTRVAVVGAGLAGAEAAWQLARRGLDVDLFESRPAVMTPAHQTADFAELVCSNSLGSTAVGAAKGLLVAELAAAGSLIVRVAREHAVAAGQALAVDRARFAGRVTELLAAEPRIRVIRQAVTALPDPPAIVATGPLTLPPLAEALAALGGAAHLHFYDATSPIVAGESLNPDIVFAANRRDGEAAGDYLNCPLNQEEYRRFYEALSGAAVVTPHGFEDERVFEACMPIEQIARRGPDTLRYGPMRPVGLRDPRTGARFYAVVQLRRENAAGDLWNLVGFQTRMTFGEQRRVLRLIPGMENAEFLRYGVIHRNTYIDGPRLLRPDLSLRARPGIRLAGQLIGVEGYLESTAMGLLAAWFAAAEAAGKMLDPPPETTFFGALLRYVTGTETMPFAPMNANFGLLPPMPEIRGKRVRKQRYHERGLADLQAWLRASASFLEKTFD